MFERYINIKCSELYATPDAPLQHTPCCVGCHDELEQGYHELPDIDSEKDFDSSDARSQLWTRACCCAQMAFAALTREQRRKLWQQALDRQNGQGATPPPARQRGLGNDGR